MLPDLPLELQLWILDLALPPADTRRHRNLRIEALRNFSLVHRTWTPLARRRLDNLLYLRLGESGESHDSVVASRIEEATKRGWDGKQLTVKTVEGWAACTEPKKLDTVEELWLVHPQCATPETIPLSVPCAFTTLPPAQVNALGRLTLFRTTTDAKRLHIYLAKSSVEVMSPNYLTAGSAYQQLGSPNLTLLLEGGVLKLNPSHNSFDKLETVILRDMRHWGPQPTFMGTWGRTAIRNFCIIREQILRERDFGQLPSTLEHFAYGPPRQRKSEIFPLDPGINLPASLRTVTLVLPSNDRGRYSALEDSLRQICEARTVTLDVFLEGPGDAAFDCEEWALSVTQGS